jgi:hypothetical protein
MVAANKLYQAFQDGGHPDDCEIKRKYDRSGAVVATRHTPWRSGTVGWHDRTTADHQQQLNTWAARGYRTISLSVYGPRPRRSALRGGDDQAGPADGREAALRNGRCYLQATFDAMAKQGFGLLIVTATGSGNNPLFAASWFETSPIPLTKVGMTAAELTAHEQGRSERWSDPAVRRWLWRSRHPSLCRSLVRQHR